MIVIMIEGSEKCNYMKVAFEPLSLHVCQSAVFFYIVQAVQ